MKKFSEHIFVLALLLIFFSSCNDKNKESAVTEHAILQEQEESENIITNPIHEGYYADPEIVKEGDTFFIYATIDPWGGEKLAILETKDFKSFTTHHPNWPTKEACTSPTSGDAMVWAPDVIKAENGNYYMYISVGSEIWAGVSENPLGPWKNAKEDNTPLIKSTFYIRNII